ncbi:MAG: glycosyltransferase family 2 protein [bacterium]
MITTILFLISLICLGHTYIFYPLILILLSLVAKKGVARDENFLPAVSLLVAAYNEEKIIREKVENSLSIDYPKDKLEIIITSDGSTDKTNEIVAEYKDIILKELPRAGKITAVNKTLPQATGEIIVLSDANTMYEKDAIKKLIRNFKDETVGGVTGKVLLTSEKATYGQGESLYGKYERYIQKKESQIFSVIGVDGAMYAIRKNLFKRIPPEIILDDLVNGMNIVKQGYRVIYDESAVGYEDTAASSKGEFIRRVRVSGGGFQMIVKNQGVPSIKQPFLLFQFISHKLFRWLTPFFLIILFTTNLFLININLFYKICFICQSLFYLLALIGGFFKLKALGTPFYFCLIQLASLIGVYRLITGKLRVTWTKGRE